MLFFESDISYDRELLFLKQILKTFILNKNLIARLIKNGRNVFLEAITPTKTQYYSAFFLNNKLQITLLKKTSSAFSPSVKLYRGTKDFIN